MFPRDPTPCQARVQKTRTCGVDIYRMGLNLGFKWLMQVKFRSKELINLQTKPRLRIPARIYIQRNVMTQNKLYRQHIPNN